MTLSMGLYSGRWIIPLICVSLAAVGCTTTFDVRHPTSMENWPRDDYQCRQEAREPYGAGGRYGIEINESMWASCLRARGYVLTPK
jgi:hypothetical protein